MNEITYQVIIVLGTMLASGGIVNMWIKSRLKRSEYRDDLMKKTTEQQLERVNETWEWLVKDAKKLDEIIEYNYQLRIDIAKLEQRFDDFKKNSRIQTETLKLELQTVEQERDEYKIQVDRLIELIGIEQSKVLELTQRVEMMETKLSRINKWFNIFTKLDDESQEILNNTFSQLIEEFKDTEK